MLFDNQDFIIKSYKDKKTGKSQNVLRRYKGKDSVVVVPEGVEKIGDYAFADDVEPNESIEKILIPDSVREIASRAFAWCMALKEIEFPKKMKEFFIEFDNCPSIAEITVPENVMKVGNLRFTKTLRKINVGENITYVALSFFEKNKPMTASRPDQIADALLLNPVYAVEGAFVVNTKYRTTLFRLNFDETEVRIPDGIETIGPNTFYELYQYSKLASSMKPVEKIIIPRSVKKINRNAFFGCASIKEVVYEGFSTDIDISQGAFLMCEHFSNDGSEIICKDSAKQKNKDPQSQGLRVDRFMIIHKLIKSGEYPNKKEIMEICAKRLNLESYSEPTFDRDLNFMRYRMGAVIEYDRKRKGYYYGNEDFELDLNLAGLL